MNQDAKVSRSLAGCFFITGRSLKANPSGSSRAPKVSQAKAYELTCLDNPKPHRFQKSCKTIVTTKPWSNFLVVSIPKHVYFIFYFYQGAVESRRLQVALAERMRKRALNAGLWRQSAALLPRRFRKRFLAMFAGSPSFDTYPSMLLPRMGVDGSPTLFRTFCMAHNHPYPQVSWMH